MKSAGMSAPRLAARTVVEWVELRAARMGHTSAAQMAAQWAATWGDSSVDRWAGLKADRRDAHWVEKTAVY